ncbi:MAG: hypothetical protein QOH51_3118 [Acidobacteriota bacterium]|nr:hypothetical protein [Acidobacteriota bacterium]
MKRVFQWIDTMVNKLAKNYTLWTIGLLVIVLLIALKAFSTVFPRLPEPPVYASYQLLQPNDWSDDRRERYYQISQGSLVIPYAWYLALESRTGTEMFASPEVQARYGLLPDNNPKYNPDRLPVGIVKDILPDEYVNTLGEGQKEWASISCAACHTGQLLYKGNALRVDGGQSFWGFEQWSGDLEFSLILTSATPSKFERFCSRIYGRGKCLPNEQRMLRAQMKRYFDSDLITGGINENINHTYLTKEGFARTSALGRGVNGEFGPLDYRNVNRNSGPVSYPPVWYTHEYDWVQSPAAISQPLGRNVTEAWGVSVRAELKDASHRWASTARIDNMFWLETLLSTLQAPKWPENLFGPIDREAVERGRRLYNDKVWDKALPADQIELTRDDKGFIRGPNPERPKTGYCARCHSPAFTEPNEFGRRFIQLPLYDMKKMGTDKYDAEQFAARTKIYTGILKPVFGTDTVGIGDMLRVNITGMEDWWFKEHDISGPCRSTMEGYRPNLFRAPIAYPARPLDGYWATGPFLHNGAIRTLYELLSPREERAKTFWTGTREFDPVDVGFRNDQVEGAFLFDTSEPGNSNAGHEFTNAPPNTDGVIGPYLSPQERRDIIEYLKVLVSVTTTPEQLAERNNILDAMSPYYEKFEGPGQFGMPEKEGGWKRSDLCGKIAGAAQPHDQAPPQIKQDYTGAPPPQVNPQGK